MATETLKKQKTRSAPPIRQKGEDGKPFPFNATQRPRGEHLRKDEVESLCKAAGSATGAKGEKTRHGVRDSAMIWIAFVHGLRARELVELKLDQYDFKAHTVRIARIKNGKPSTHPVEKRELAMLKRLVGDRRHGYVFVTERGEQLTTSNFGKIVARAGRLVEVDGEKELGIGFPVHPHMLRHSCGYWLNEQGHNIRVIQDWLGHKNIRHTEGYTALSPKAFDRIKFS